MKDHAFEDSSGAPYMGAFASDGLYQGGQQASQAQQPTAQQLSQQHQAAMQQIPQPTVSLDPQSGQYFDPQTGWLYDVQTGYYVDPQSGQPYDSSVYIQSFYPQFFYQAQLQQQQAAQGAQGGAYQGGQQPQQAQGAQHAAQQVQQQGQQQGQQYQQASAAQQAQQAQQFQQPQQSQQSQQFQQAQGAQHAAQQAAFNPNPYDGAQQAASQYVDQTTQGNPYAQQEAIQQGDGSEDQPKKRSKLKLILIIGIIVLALAAAGITVWLLFFNQPDPSKDIVAGNVEGMSLEEIQKVIDDTTEQSKFQTSIASVVIFDSPDANGEWRIENPEGNEGKLMKVTVTVDDTGEQIYESGMIKPGYHIQTAPLDKELDPGSYYCTATFSAYNEDNGAFMGETATKFRLQIKSG